MQGRKFSFVNSALVVGLLICGLVCFLNHRALMDSYPNSNAAPVENFHAMLHMTKLSVQFAKANFSLTSRYKIPKILHQSWKNADLPPKYAQYRATWLKLHPDWVHHLWTDEENREMLRLHYPWFLQYYDALPLAIERADTLRYFYMHRFGGIYADLDTEPLKPLDFLLNNATAPITLAYLDRKFKDLSNNIPGAFIVSEPGHVLWMIVIRCVIKKFTEGRHKKIRPDYVTGPGAVASAISAYYQSGAKNMMLLDARKTWVKGSLAKGSSQVGDIKMLAPGLIYPFTWRDSKTKIGEICSGSSRKQNETECKKLFPNAYTISYHSFSWKDDWQKYRS